MKSVRRRVIRWVLRVPAAALGVFLVVRAVVVLRADQPSRPDTYRRDWGGPHYWGVIAVHVTPALIAIGLAGYLLLRRRATDRRNTRQRPAGRP